MSTVNVRRTEVGVVVAAPGPSLDLATSATLRRLLDEACRQSGTVVLDLSAVTFADSSALGVMVSVQRRLQAEGGSLVVVHVQERVLRVMRISGLLRRVPESRTPTDPTPGDPTHGDPTSGDRAGGELSPVRPIHGRTGPWRDGHAAAGRGAAMSG